MIFFILIFIMLLLFNVRRAVAQLIFYLFNFGLFLDFIKRFFIPRPVSLSVVYFNFIPVKLFFNFHNGVNSSFIFIVYPYYYDFFFVYTIRGEIFSFYLSSRFIVILPIFLVPSSSVLFECFNVRNNSLFIC